MFCQPDFGNFLPATAFCLARPEQTEPGFRGFCVLGEFDHRFQIWTWYLMLAFSYEQNSGSDSSFSIR